MLVHSTRRDHESLDDLDNGKLGCYLQALHLQLTAYLGRVWPRVLFPLSRIPKVGFFQ